MGRSRLNIVLVASFGLAFMLTGCANTSWTARSSGVEYCLVEPSRPVAIAGSNSPNAIRAVLDKSTSVVINRSAEAGLGVKLGAKQQIDPVRFSASGESRQVIYENWMSFTEADVTIDGVQETALVGITARLEVTARSTKGDVLVRDGRAFEAAVRHEKVEGTARSERSSVSGSSARRVLASECEENGNVSLLSSCVEFLDRLKKLVTSAEVEGAGELLLKPRLFAFKKPVNRNDCSFVDDWITKLNDERLVFSVGSDNRLRGKITVLPGAGSLVFLAKDWRTDKFVSNHGFMEYNAPKDLLVGERNPRGPENYWLKVPIRKAGRYVVKVRWASAVDLPIGLYVGDPSHPECGSTPESWTQVIGIPLVTQTGGDESKDVSEFSFSPHRLEAGHACLMITRKSGSPTLKVPSLRDITIYFHSDY